MALSGNQTTRTAAGGSGLSYAVFLAKSESVGLTPDCFVAFVGTITERTMSDAVFIGLLTDTKTLIGALDVKDGAFIGTLTDENALIGNICND